MRKLICGILSGVAALLLVGCGYQNLTHGKEAEADPYLTDEEIEAELEAEINK